LAMQPKHIASLGRHNPIRFDQETARRLVNHANGNADSVGPELRGSLVQRGEATSISSLAFHGIVKVGGRMAGSSMAVGGHSRRRWITNLRGGTFSPRRKSPRYGRVATDSINGKDPTPRSSAR
jgi:hypothetical protein